MKMDVSIVIVNYNTRKMTSECIESIFKYTKHLNFEVILVDNASRDGSKTVFEKYNNITYVYNEENVGFGYANNIGVKKAVGNYILFLNSDTLLYRNIIKDMVDFANAYQHLNIGGIGSVLEDANGEYSPSFGQFLSIKGMFNNFCKRFVPEKSYQSVKNNELVQNSYAFVDYIIGADLFVPASLFKELHGFDSDYFMFYEEEDLQKRMEYLFKKRVIINKNGIIHFESKSFANKVSFKRVMLMKKSSFIYIRKHFSNWKYMLIHILHFVVGIRNMTLNYRHFSSDQKLKFLIKK